MPTAPGSDHAAVCAALRQQYFNAGCPGVTTGSHYNHPVCVAIRDRMTAQACPVPGRGGLGDAATATAAQFFNGWLGKSPDATKIALDKSSLGQGIGVSFDKAQPGVVFITRDLADKLLLNTAATYSDGITWLGAGGKLDTVGTLRARLATKAPSAALSPPATTGLSSSQKWLIAGGVAAALAGLVLRQRRK